MLRGDLVTKLNINSHLKPSLDEIISVAILFPMHDRRREELWSLIIRDEDLTKELAAKVKGITPRCIPRL